MSSALLKTGKLNKSLKTELLREQLDHSEVNQIFELQALYLRVPHDWASKPTLLRYGKFPILKHAKI